MKRKKIILVGFSVFGLLWFFGSRATAQSGVTTTLLPTKTEYVPQQSQDDMLRIEADRDNKPVRTVRLGFDLSAIPSGAVINKATLRLVAGDRGEKSRSVQIVKIFKSSKKEPVATWTSKEETCCAFLTFTSSLRDTVAGALQEKVELSLTLSSTSRLSEWQYYSMSEYGKTSSNKPRLIIEYKPPQALLEREQARDTTKTRWKFFPQPTNVTVKPFLDKMTEIISNPVFYDGGIYLFAQPSSQETMLYALYPGGGSRWGPKPIQMRPGSHALVTNSGRLYSIGEDRFVIYDLEKEGTLIKNVYLKDFKPALRPTVGADGSLYAIPSGRGYIYGFNPDPQELWRYRSDDTKLADASRITLSPDAGRYAYALTKIDTKTHLVRIDSAAGNADVYDLPIVKIKRDGQETDKNLDLGFIGFHRPVAIEGPQQDYVFLSAYNEGSGILLAYSDGAVIWWQEGPVSQPIVDWGEERVFAVKSNMFRGYKKFNGEQICASRETYIAATSNLLKDGEDNVYFWNNGILFGYTKDCKNFLSQDLSQDLSQEAKLLSNLELMFSPDGTLYARTLQNRLYTITPTQNQVTLTQNNLQTDTIYSAEIIQAAANLDITSEKIILKAEKSISFGTGLSVKKGASVRCRIGL